MKTALLFCIVISIGLIECQHAKKARSTRPGLSAALSSASRSLSTLLKTSQKARAGGQKINPTLRAQLHQKLERSQQKLNGALQAWQRSYMRKHSKRQFEQALQQISRSILQNAIAPSKKSDNEIKDRSIDTIECEQFIHSVHEYMDHLCECAANGEDPKELLMQYLGKPEASARGFIYEALSSHSNVFLRLLMLEHKECVATCDSIGSLIDSLGQISILNAEDIEEDDFDDYPL